MNEPAKNSEGTENYWEKAGEVSYAAAMFTDSEVERHVNQRCWDRITDMAAAIGLNKDSRILDLGCGDGAFANLHLSRFFDEVEGFDLSSKAIARANEHSAKPNITFNVADITQMDFSTVKPYDGAFLMGILHHVKPHAPMLIKKLAEVAPKVLVLEPNGAHPVRKMLERTQVYKDAGEESFRALQIAAMFNAAGYEQRLFKRTGVFPNFTPSSIFRLLRGIEGTVESMPVLNWNCTTNLFAFVKRG